MKTDARIQVYFPKQDYAALKEKARLDGISVGELLRRAAKKYLRADPASELREGYRLLMEGAGVCRDTAGGNVSEKHDQYLGEKRW